MKIIMTGFTALQIGTTNRAIAKIDVPGSIVDALRANGHEVEWRKVMPGEDLSGFDVAWVNLSALHSLNGRAGAMGALWTLASGLPAVGFFDDWQAPSITFNGARALIKRPQIMYKYLLVGAAHRGDEDATYYSREAANAARDRIVAVNPEIARKIYVERFYLYDTDEQVKPVERTLLASAEALLDARWHAGMVPVCPMYAWGDRTLVRKRVPKALGPIEALDPSPTIYGALAQHDPLPPDEKKREWVLGALMPHDAWVDKGTWSWPVSFVGSKKMVRAKNGDRLKTEGEVIQRYNEHWGILSPPYNHSGSGWWRSRFMYSARVRSVLLCDKGEGDPLGAPYKIKARDVEVMTTAQLAQLAEDQAQALRAWMPPVEQFAYHVERIVQRARAEDGGWRPS